MESKKYLSTALIDSDSVECSDQHCLFVWLVLTIQPDVSPSRFHCLFIAGKPAVPGQASLQGDLLLLHQRWKAPVHCTESTHVTVHHRLWTNSAAGKAQREAHRQAAHLHQHLLLLLPWHPTEEDGCRQEGHEEDSKGEVDVKFRLTHLASNSQYRQDSVCAAVNQSGRTEGGCSASLVLGTPSQLVDHNAILCKRSESELQILIQPTLRCNWRGHFLSPIWTFCYSCLVLQ